MEKAKILIVDDRPENLFVLESLLEDLDIELIKAQSGNEALARVLDHDFALVLLDIQMPGMDGYEVAELMRGNTLTRNIPIIFVTAKHKEKASVFKGYDSGAVDYLFKPLEPAILKGKVAVFLELYRQKKELEDKTCELDKRLAELEELKGQLEESNKKLILLSRQDGLTGLLNRRSFDELLIEEWQRGVRNKSNISVLLADIDYFKSYNDTYGHTLGDEVLKRVAQQLKLGPKRHIDKVARYGGEEFVIILPNTDLAGAELMAEKLKKDIFDLHIVHEGAEGIGRVTISTGVATIKPRIGMNSLTLIEAADTKLYEAKASGRNCWCSIEVEENEEKDNQVQSILPDN